MSLKKIGCFLLVGAWTPLVICIVLGIGGNALGPGLLAWAMTPVAVIIMVIGLAKEQSRK